jgi:hypothetical protein
MNPKELLLISQLLESASDSFSMHECTEFSYPDSWTKKDKEDFVLKYHQWSEDREDPIDWREGDTILSDWEAMEYLSFKTAEWAAKIEDMMDRMIPNIIDEPSPMDGGRRNSDL